MSDTAIEALRYSEFPNSSDCISRQAAIDAIDRLDIPEDMCVFEILSHIELEIGNLPSAQPDIILCKDCKYWEYDTIFADGWCRGKHQGNPDWYCADAERGQE